MSIILTRRLRESLIDNLSLAIRDNLPMLSARGGTLFQTKNVIFHTRIQTWPQRNCHHYLD